MAQWTAWRRSAEGRAQRERSRTRYRGFSRSEAIDLARAKFPQTFAHPVWKAPTFASGFTFDEFVNDHMFFVKTGRGYERHLVQTTLPSSAINEQGKRALVSTDLVRSGDAFMPENSAAPAAIDGQANGQVEFELSGVAMSLVGATASAAEAIDDKAVFPDALPDVDYTVAAMPDGVESFLNLRSSEATEEVRFRFDLPAGAQLQLTDNAITPVDRGASVGAKVVKDGETIQQIAPPTATDADGAPVPVRYALDGNELILKIDHRAGDFLYPILVDPYVIAQMGSNLGNPAFGFGMTDGRIRGYDCTWNSGCWTSPGGQFSGPGLYISAEADLTYGPSWSRYGEFYYKAPRGSNIVRVDWNSWGHVWGNSCVFGEILDATYTQLQSNQLSYCGNGSGNTAVFAGGNGSSGNWARFLHMQLDGTYWRTWSRVRDPMIHLWEGWAPYFQSLRPQDPAQWDEGARTTRWLKEGEVFRYQYNVHDDGLGLDWIDENNFGRGSRAASTGRCDYPVFYCDYDYTLPENGSTWAANETNTFPEGITNNWARAADNIGNQGCCYSWFIKVDRTPPTLAVGGSLSALDGHTVAAGTYDLSVTAKDGDPSSSSTQRSGVKSLNVQVIGPDGTVERANPQHVDCWWGNCSQADNLSFDTNTYGVGTHTFRITSHDMLDQGVQRDITVTFEQRDGDGDNVYDIDDACPNERAITSDGCPDYGANGLLPSPAGDGVPTEQLPEEEWDPETGDETDDGEDGSVFRVLTTSQFGSVPKLQVYRPSLNPCGRNSQRSFQSAGSPMPTHSMRRTFRGLGYDQQGREGYKWHLHYTMLSSWWPASRRTVMYVNYTMPSGKIVNPRSDSEARRNRGVNFKPWYAHTTILVRKGTSVSYVAATHIDPPQPSDVPNVYIRSNVHYGQCDAVINW